jgi:hypothetical protein
MIFFPRSAFTMLPVRNVLLSAFALATAVVLLPAQAGNSQAPSPRTAQAFTSIKDILARDGEYLRTTQTTNNKYSSKLLRTYVVTATNGCNAVVESEAHVHTEFATQQRVVDRNWIDEFHPNFVDLDPSTVIVQDPLPPQGQSVTKGYLVRIAVEAGKPLIPARAVDKAENEARQTPGVPTLAVYVKTREAADRLAKAFTDAATGCRANPGGK